MSRIAIIGDDKRLVKNLFIHILPHQPVAIKWIHFEQNHEPTFTGRCITHHNCSESDKLVSILEKCDTLWLDLSSAMIPQLKLIKESIVVSKIRSVVVTRWETTSEEQDDFYNGTIPFIHFYKCFFWEDLSNLFYSSCEPYLTNEVEGRLEIEKNCSRQTTLSWGKIPDYPPIKYGISIYDYAKCLTQVLLNPIRYLDTHIKPCGEKISLKSISEFINLSNTCQVDIPPLQDTPPDYIRYQEHAQKLNPDTQLFYTWMKNNSELFA